MSMSIGTIITGIGSFLSGPIMTGAANVATFANLGIGIATKVDTSNIKGQIGGVRSDLKVVSDDILALTCDMSDFRKESQWNVALSGNIPVNVTNGTPSYATEFGGVAASQSPQTPTVQQPTQQPQPTLAPQAEYVTKSDLEQSMSSLVNNMLGSIPTMVAEGFKAMMPQPTSTSPTPTAAPAPEVKPEDKA